MLLLTLLGVAAAATPIHAAPAGVEPLIPAPTDGNEPLIPDSATGAGAEPESWPEAVLPPARFTPTPSPAPASPGGPSLAPTRPQRPEPEPSRPERPALVPRTVPVGDLALQMQPGNPGDAEAMPPEPLRYPLAVAAPERNPWGWRYSPARGAWRMHTGVDLIVPEGTAVLAVKGGRVQRVDRIDGYGLTVLIDHGGGWSSLYAHLLKASVSPGETVGAGQTLGLVGQSGNATTPHLHLELRQRQPGGLVAVDPTGLLPAPDAAAAMAGDIRP